MIVANVGVGTGPDPEKAGREACLQALSLLPEKRADLVFVFSSVTHDQDKLLSSVASTTGNALVTGCSTAGEISSEGLASEKSVVVLALASDTVRFFGASGHHLIWNAMQAGQDCANKLQYDSRGYVTSALLFLDVMSGKTDQAIAGFLERIGKGFPVYGAAAADDLLFFETYQYLGDKVYSGSIVGVGLAGEYVCASVAAHGFLPVGIARRVTRAEGTTLIELDGKPAASIYEEYFGEEHLPELHEGLLPTMAVSYPLGVFLPNRNDAILRNPVFVDKNGAMTFTAAIPEGAEVRLMISDIEEGLRTAEAAASELLLRLGGRRPRAALVINSVARKKMLGLRADEEIQLIQSILGRDVPIAGFYSYGQILSQEAEIGAPFHNGSILIWAIAEK